MDHNVQIQGQSAVGVITSVFDGSTSSLQLPASSLELDSNGASKSSSSSSEEAATLAVLMRCFLARRVFRDKCVVVECWMGFPSSSSFSNLSASAILVARPLRWPRPSIRPVENCQRKSFNDREGSVPSPRPSLASATRATWETPSPIVLFKGLSSPSEWYHSKSSLVAGLDGDSMTD